MDSVFDSLGRVPYISPTGEAGDSMTAASAMIQSTDVSDVLRRYAEAEVPTARGSARMVVYQETLPDGEIREHVAVVFGAPAEEQAPLVRVHSECLTSEVLGSLKCDCRAQLDQALDEMAAKGTGVLLYMRQEGRGIGLGNKIRAYALQAEGADTVEANHKLGFETDYRRYDVAAAILRDLGIARVTLLTNNPRKVDGLSDAGIEVAERAPVLTASNAHSAPYLSTKRTKLGHFLDE